MIEMSPGANRIMVAPRVISRYLSIFLVDLKLVENDTIVIKTKFKKL